ncbi:MAG: SRPBCC family protein, partial [Chthoniobacterales bacterium]
MTNTIQREILIPQPREQVWRAIADSTALAGWMFPNDFEPRIGHHFTFRVPGNPQVNFDGLTVHCEVLE